VKFRNLNLIIPVISSFLSKFPRYLDVNLGEEVENQKALKSEEATLHQSMSKDG